MKLTIVGAGYVGFSLAVLLSRKHNVTLLEINKTKISKINSCKSPIKDRLINSYLSKKKLNLKATDEISTAYKNPEFVIIAVPTNYDTQTGNFDTRIVESVIKDIIRHSPQSNVIIKSTVPVGFTKKIPSKYKTKKIIFSPEFLREGKALYDNLYPTRIVIGDKSSIAKEFGKL